MAAQTVKCAYPLTFIYLNTLCQSSGSNEKVRRMDEATRFRTTLFTWVLCKQDRKGKEDTRKENLSYKSNK